LFNVNDEVDGETAVDDGHKKWAAKLELNELNKDPTCNIKFQQVRNKIFDIRSK
jgi:hypothetical protein